MTESNKIQVTERMHHCQSAWEIRTPAATYIFQQDAGGFSSILDPEGQDWLSYAPGDGPRGEYRGIPNLVFPEGLFHPGCSACKSRLKVQTETQVVIESSAEQGQWLCEWVIDPARAELTVHQAPRPYWFLYEGTPGGTLETSEDWLYTADQGRQLLSESWDRVLPDPKWIIFGDGKSGRGLFLYRHSSEAVNECYWPMEEAMTVFGYGRRGGTPLLTEAPTKFTVALLEADALRSENLTQNVQALLKAPA